MEEALKEATLLVNRYNKSLSGKLYNYGRSKIISFIMDIEKHIPKKAIRIIDVGCGSGLPALYFYFKNKKRSIIGYDLNKQRIKNLKRLVKNASISNVDFSQRDFIHSSDVHQGDIVLFIDLLHHVPFRTQKRLLKAAYLNAANDGRIIIKEINSECSLKFFVNYMQDKIISRGKKLYFRPLRSWVKMIESIGFRVKSVETPNSILYPHILIVADKVQKRIM